MIKVIKRPHTYLILNMFKNVLAGVQNLDEKSKFNRNLDFNNK
jgi:hypothetical protein